MEESKLNKRERFSFGTVPNKINQSQGTQWPKTSAPKSVRFKPDVELIPEKHPIQKVTPQIFHSRPGLFSFGRNDKQAQEQQVTDKEVDNSLADFQFEFYCPDTQSVFKKQATDKVVDNSLADFQFEFYCPDTQSVFKASDRGPDFHEKPSSPWERFDLQKALMSPSGQISQTKQIQAKVPDVDAEKVYKTITSQMEPSELKDVKEFPSGQINQQKKVQKQEESKVILKDNGKPKQLTQSDETTYQLAKCTSNYAHEELLTQVKREDNRISFQKKKVQDNGRLDFNSKLVIRLAEKTDEIRKLKETCVKDMITTLIEEIFKNKYFQSVTTPTYPMSGAGYQKVPDVGCGSLFDKYFKEEIKKVVMCNYLQNKTGPKKRIQQVAVELCIEFLEKIERKLRLPNVGSQDITSRDNVLHLIKDQKQNDNSQAAENAMNFVDKCYRYQFWTYKVAPDYDLPQGINVITEKEIQSFWPKWKDQLLPHLFAGYKKQGYQYVLIGNQKYGQQVFHHFFENFNYIFLHEDSSKYHLMNQRQQIRFWNTNIQVQQLVGKMVINHDQVYSKLDRQPFISILQDINDQLQTQDYTKVIQSYNAHYLTLINVLTKGKYQSLLIECMRQGIIPSDGPETTRIIKKFYQEASLDTVNRQVHDLGNHHLFQEFTGWETSTPSRQDESTQMKQTDKDYVEEQKAVQPAKQRSLTEPRKERLQQIHVRETDSIITVKKETNQETKDRQEADKQTPEKEENWSKQMGQLKQYQLFRPQDWQAGNKIQTENEWMQNCHSMIRTRSLKEKYLKQKNSLSERIAATQKLKTELIEQLVYFKSADEKRVQMKPNESSDWY